MKKIFVFTILAAGMISCNTADKKDGKVETLDNEKLKDSLAALQGAQTPDTANATTIQWVDSTTTDLGKLKKDQQVEVTFRFKNSGDKNLVIENVTAPCGCTIPEKPEKPFAPGEEGIIKARFNGSGSGHIQKTVTVTANTKPYRDHVLTFTGEIQESK